MGKHKEPMTEKQKKYIDYLFDEYKDDIHEPYDEVMNYSKFEASIFISSVLDIPNEKKRKLEEHKRFCSALGLSEAEFELWNKTRYGDNDIECKGHETGCGNLPLWVGFKLTGEYKQDKNHIYYVYRLPSDPSKFFIVLSSRCFGWSDYLHAFNIGMSALEICDRYSYYIHTHNLRLSNLSTEDTGITLDMLEKLPELDVLIYNGRACKENSDRGILFCKRHDIINHKVLGRGTVLYCPEYDSVHVLFDDHKVLCDTVQASSEFITIVEPSQSPYNYTC